MLGPIYALFVSEIGGSLLDASLAMAVFALAAGVTTLIAGKYADKTKHRELILVGSYMVIAMGFALYVFVDSIWALLVVQLLIGFAEAAYLPAIDSLIAKHISEKRAGRLWGAAEANYYFATAIGAVIGGIIVTLFGFNIMFLIMAGLCFISGLYIYFLPRKAL